MNGKIETSNTSNKVKIFKPKAVRLCPPRRKQINQTSNQNNKKFKKKGKSKKNLDDISIEEINKDFMIYKDYKEEDFSAIVVHIFFRYIAFVRKIQVHFQLEPAGAHGVWGLDEYQFLSFLIGSAQLIDNENITPSQAIDDDILEKYKDDFMYLSCIKHIKTVKHGGSFGEYAPLLYSITGVANWEKVAKGLVKMYEDEVLKKFVVVQHFYFGSILIFG